MLALAILIFYVIKRFKTQNFSQKKQNKLIIQNVLLPIKNYAISVKILVIMNFRSKFNTKILISLKSLTITFFFIDGCF